MQVSLAIGTAFYFTEDDGDPFSKMGLSLIPSMLGFTIGAMAIVISVASTSIFRHMAEEGEPSSYFMKLVANFFHYIVLQVLALLSCIVAERTCFAAVDALATVMTIYSMVQALAIGAMLFGMAKIFNSGSAAD
jgi:hypothetical protein